mmetsp:Transcript_108869/g.314380  ORF Transcript_108869/g.314380 Transcript_108869/m.314380 type:complete len:103 (+) Transcript_108869:243-551(+)
MTLTTTMNFGNLPSTSSSWLLDLWRFCVYAPVWRCAPAVIPTFKALFKEVLKPQKSFEPKFWIANVWFWGFQPCVEDNGRNTLSCTPRGSNCNGCHGKQACK